MLDPPEIPAAGRSVSPSRTVTRSTGTPSPSAAPRASSVVMPLPISWCAQATSAEPSGPSRTRMVAAAIFTGRTEAAQPSPTRQGPSRIEPGRGTRRDQPKARAPAAKQAISGRVENGFPETGSTAVSLIRRSAIGSMPSATAISSTALSRANRNGTSGGARIGPGVLRSTRTARSAVRMFGQA